MDHPLLSNRQNELRKRMVYFLKNALAVQRTSNILFLCGGNKSHDMRISFRDYCEEHLSEYEIFMPESAMGTIFTDDLAEQFDLADFEELVGGMSYAIVVFPEAPGSYAETGYFSAVPHLAKKCILVMDLNRQQDDSFLSLGPAKKISEKSNFYPNINLDYGKPEFETILERIRSRRTHKTKKHLTLDRFSALSPYEIAALLHTIVDLCGVATVMDIQYLLTAIFKNQFSAPRVQKLLSILVGSTYLQVIGNYGHFSSNTGKPLLVTVREGHKHTEMDLRLELAEVCHDGDPEFVQLIEEATRVN